MLISLQFKSGNVVTLKDQDEDLAEQILESFETSNQTSFIAKNIESGKSKISIKMQEVEAIEIIGEE